MPIKFKEFVSGDFQKSLDIVSQFKYESEENNLSIYRFKSKYLKELKVFQDRMAELNKTFSEKLKESEIEEGSQVASLSAEKKEVLKAISSEHNDKVEELLNCESELKPLDYKKISTSKPTPHDLAVLEGVLVNIPTAAE